MRGCRLDADQDPGRPDLAFCARTSRVGHAGLLPGTRRTSGGGTEWTARGVSVTRGPGLHRLLDDAGRNGAASAPGEAAPDGYGWASPRRRARMPAANRQLIQAADIKAQAGQRRDRTTAENTRPVLKRAMAVRALAWARPRQHAQQAAAVHRGNGAGARAAAGVPRGEHGATGGRGRPARPSDGPGSPRPAT